MCGLLAAYLLKFLDVSRSFPVTTHVHTHTHIARITGKDYMNQLHRIFDVLGTPSHEDTEFIAHQKVLRLLVSLMVSFKAQAYVRSLPTKTRASFKTLFPKASVAGSRCF